HYRAGRMRLPVFTLKASAILGLALATEAFLFIVSFRQALGGAGLSESAFALATITLTIDLFAPFLSFVLVLLSKLPTAVGRWYLLHKARARRLSFENLLVIGITGSYGKTSTKEFLATILSRNFRVAKVPDHINSDIALARYLLRELNDTHEVLVAEMGAYRQGEIRRLAAVLRPQIGILTGINEQHIALFGGIEKTKAAKYELVESLPEKGLAIFNADSPGSRELYERCDRPKKCYSAAGFPADCYALDIRTEIHRPSEEGGEDGKGALEEVMLVFQIRTGEESRTCKVPLFGSHHVPNILAAATAALSLGMTLDAVRECAQYLRAPGRTMHLGAGRDGRIVIDDSYSANPTGVFAALESLRFFTGRRKVLVMPSLIELGSTSERVHEEIGKKIAEICDLAIITTPDGFAAIERGIGSVEKAACIDDPTRILALITHETKAGDVILLESRVPERVKNALLGDQ
ncbi:MAG: UDP-N-acetylmuramoyl-tripeptide--D-alanyl-D-alanine ligase, partial [Patescibacteria group bacterium]|nr:UDP-N-acetylmuramoyl-tripeptide--D-alanyl-D-alanine ligase [Patescibacteria group bacterium]